MPSASYPDHGDSPWDDELKDYLDGREAEAAASLAAHASDTANPHAVTKAQVGLSNVANTTDASVLASAATAAASASKSADTIVEGTTTKILTATERTKLAGIETGAQVNSIIVLARSLPTVSPGVVNTATETALCTLTVAAAQVAANDFLEFKYVLDVFNNSGSTRTMTFRLKLGSTTLNNTGAISVTVSANRGRVTGCLTIGLAALNDQRCGFNQSLTLGTAVASNTGSITGANVHVGSCTASEDLTTDKSLVLTVQHSVADANLDARLISGVLTRVR